MPRYTISSVTDNLYLLRIDDRKTRFFEGLWEIPEGITYNAYVLVTSEGAVIFDTWKAGFAEDFIEAVREVTPLSKVKYLVLHHGEPDHTGSVPKLLEAVEKEGGSVTVLGHPMIKGMIESMYGVKPSFKPVRDGETLEIGGIQLLFIYTPWLHWPETIMTFIPEYKALLSCDAFGAYSLPEKLFDDEASLENYEAHVRKYVVTVIGRFREHIIKAIEKLGSRGIQPSIIAPSHGIVWRKSPEHIIALYEKLGRGEPTKGKVVVIYGSMYGFVKAIVKEAVRMLEERGFNVKVFGFTDSTHPPVSDVLSEIGDAEALVIGASTYEGGVLPSIENVLSLIKKKARYKGRLALIIGAYGWAPSAGKIVKKELEEAGYTVIGPVEVKGRAQDEDIAVIEKLVDELAQRLTE